MKNVLFILLTLIFCTSITWAQCPTGDLDFTTQQQIDDFATQYPNCTELPGSIMISGSDIFDLRAFRNITSVGGSLLILNCTNLTHTTGFENLSLLNGSLIMTHNPSLVDVFGLSNLQYVYGNFVITDNPVLEDCSLDFICQHVNGGTLPTQINNNGYGCGSIEELTYPCLHGISFPSCYGSYTQNITITSQAQLNQIQPGCRVLIGNMTIDGSDITDISRLRFMSGIEGTLTIRNTSLTDLLDLNGWNFITLTNLVIENNSELTLCGMGNICRYLQEGGSATINNNGAGCSSPADLAAICSELGNCPLNYTILTQADADNFAILYPNCSILSGNMRVGPYYYYNQSDISDLSALSTLTQVYGDLIIQGNPGLTNIDGIQNVTTVLGDMFVEYNANLQNISGLQSLTTVGRDLRISGADMITDLTGLENLTAVGRELGIYYNDALLNIDALQNLTNIPGRVIIENGNLESINGLQNITTVGGLTLANNNSLLNLNGLQNLTQVDGEFEIRQNGVLADLTALQNLTSVGHLELRQGVYASLTGFENLTSLERLTIAFNAYLDDISSLSNVNPTVMGLYIRSNPALSECNLAFICNYLDESGLMSGDVISNNDVGCESDDAILQSCLVLPPECPATNITLTTQQQVNDFAATYPNCTEIPGLLQIGQSSGSLTNITDLSPLSFIASVEDISIERTQITNLNGLQGIQNIDGNMKIVLNPNLNTLDALSGITNIDEQLHIGYNKELVDFEGLNQLTSLGSLRINNNNKLTSLLALSNLQTVSQITIQNHPVLPSLAGLDNWDISVLTSLFISSNSSLATCNTPSVCNYLLTNHGSVTIYGNNATGCNSSTEIESVCQTLPDCPTGDVILQTQQDINDFVAMYSNCTEIAGMLKIGKSSGGLTDITDLSALDFLTSVASLAVERTQINTTTGLHNLQNMNGDLKIVLNPELANISFLYGITEIGGQLHIGYNKNMYNFYGFSTLMSLGSLRINNNAKLASLHQISNLQTVSEIIIQNNPILASLDGLDAVNPALLDNFIITSNPLLSSCEAVSVCNYLTVENGSAIVQNNATGCNTTTEIENACSTFSGCPLGDVILTSQQEVNDFPLMFPNCTEIQGNLELGIWGAPINDITDLSPLSQIVSIAGRLQIFSTSLSDLSDLEQLQEVHGLYIWLNPQLTTLSALSDVTSTDGTVTIAYNKELTNLDGLNQVTSVSGLTITNNKKLASIEGLSNLTTMTNANQGNNIDIWIQNNDVLTSLEGLENLDLSPLEDLRITSNPLLTTCSFDNFCDYVENNIPDQDYLIFNNASGCDNPGDVTDNCTSEPPVEDPCGGTSATDSLTLIFDEDLYIDGVGFANNPNITFTDPATPANAVLSDIQLEVYFKLAGTSCEDEIAIRVTDPAGNTQSLTAFTTCNGGTNLYYVDLNIPSGNTTGSVDDWIVEFDDTNDQNADYEYSVRFARLNYVANSEGGSGETIVNEVSDFADFDLFIDGVGFENNGTYTFADPGTPADAVLSDISLELYFRLNGNSCENEIALQLTDPAGNTQALTAYTTCDGGTGLFYVNLDIPSGNTTGSTADWLLQFDDTNDQNSDYEYSVRFGRLTYTTTHTGGVSTPVIITDEVVRVADSDLFIDGVGFDNNATYTFYDPATPEIATLSDIQLELYFRLNGNSCENEIALQLTDPAGNTQPLTAYTNCDGGTGLYYVNLDVPSGSVTGEIAPWIVQFDDTNDQNADYEYSVRFGRLTYTTQYDLCETQMMIVEENDEESEQIVNSSTQQRINYNTTKLQHHNTIKLYPVPASQHLNVEYISEKNNSTTIEILSNQGKMLMQQEEFLQEGINTIQLNIADLPAGHYHIRMYNANDMQMQSFVKIAP